jgi:excisionase family DNA binding protein
MERLLDIEELCRILGVKKATIYAWIYQHKIPHIKLNRLVRFRESEILDWLAARSRGQVLSSAPIKKLKGSSYKPTMQCDYVDKIVKGAKEHVLRRASQN